MPPLPVTPAILLELLAESAQSMVLNVAFANMVDGERVELSFVETDGTTDKRLRPDRVMGTAAGRVLLQPSGRYSFQPDQPPKPEPVASPSVRFRLETEQGISEYSYALTSGRLEREEGDAFQLLVRSDSHAIESQAIDIARIARQVERGGATYDWHGGHDVRFYNDASEDATGSAGAFRDLLDAIGEAQHFVFVVDWSFHPLFCPDRSAAMHRNRSIGATLIKKAAKNKELLVAIHTWSHTDAAADDPPNDEHQAPQTIALLARALGLEERPDNLLWRATSRTGSGWSHHQKFVVMDAPGADGRRELRVFWGGLDLTKGRFDWPAHIVDVHAPEAAAFLHRYATKDGVQETTWSPPQKNQPQKLLAVAADDWYNLELGDRRDLPRQPWHDIHGMVTGPAAWDFVCEFVGRWNVEPSVGGDHGDLSKKHIGQVWSMFRKLHKERETFVQQYEGLRTGKWSAQVFRSLTLEHWAPPAREAKDDLDKRLYRLLRTDQAQGAEHGIMLAYRQVIDRAERFIYIENQYFMGSGSRWREPRPSLANDLPERIVKRILERARAKQPFHVYIVMPLFPEGDPVAGASREVRLNEWNTIEYMAGALFKELGKRWTDYLSFYFLANWQPVTQAQFSKSKQRVDRVRAHRRYMVYVHSKMMLVDDCYLLFGSCNLNDRGLVGSRDSEIACGIWPSHGEHAEAEQIKAFRKRLWAEHFGGDVAGQDQPESGECVDGVQDHADANYRNFRTMQAGPQGHICRVPYGTAGAKLWISELGQSVPVPEPSLCLPDSPEPTDEWKWPSTGSNIVRKTRWAE